MNVIRTRGLTKTYKRFEKEEGLSGSVKSLFRRKFTKKEAVRDLNLEISRGEFVGMIGPNGAGKTTLVKMLTGIIAPSSGELSVLGHYPNKLEAAFKRRYAVVMGQKSQLFFELTPSDTFRLFKELYNIPEADYRRNIDYFVELFGVGEHLNVQVRTLSLGERMKMELIVALLHSPEILFLDEPTIGLDAVAQRQIRKFLSEVNSEKGTTIILTSHYMEDIRSLCRRCVVINGGEKIYDGDMSELFERYSSSKKVTITFEHESSPKLSGDIRILEQSPYRLSFMSDRSRTTELIRELLGTCAVSDIMIEDEDIGGVVERIYRGELPA